MDRAKTAPEYSATRYEPLNHNEDEIRLLQVDLEYGEHKLVSNISLRASKPQYTALSYTWGDQKTQQFINVNGEKFPVSSNLNQALEEVIRFWKKTYEPNGKPLLLWCDQICVNQSHDEEKNHQVAFMGMIYDRAEEVLIWLPISTSEEPLSDRRVQTMSSLRGSSDDWAKWRKWHEQRLSISGIDDRYQSSSPMVYAEEGTVSTEKETDELGDIVKAWADVHAIMQSPWWKRACK